MGQLQQTFKTRGATAAEKKTDWGILGTVEGFAEAGDVNVAIVEIAWVLIKGFGLPWGWRKTKNRRGGMFPDI